MRNIGPRQIGMILRALGSPSRMVMPSDFLERRACRRLAQRGVFVPALGYPDCWRL